MRDPSDQWTQFFDFETEVSVPARARRTDPETSHEAAARVDVGRHDDYILAYCATRPDRSCIWADVQAHYFGVVPETSLSPRFRPLINQGRLVVTGERRLAPSGRWQRVVRLRTPDDD